MTRTEQQALDYVDSIPDGGTNKHPWNDKDIERAYQTGYKQAVKDAITWWINNLIEKEPTKGYYIEAFRKYMEETR